MYKFLPILLFAYGLAVMTEDIYDDSWALIIGIDKYYSVQNLDYATADAISIQELLINKYNFSSQNVQLLLDRKATKSGILKAFSTITKNAGEKDRVLIYFAGHGETLDLPDGGELGYLIPVDGNASDLYLTAIPMDELKRISLLSKAKHILYLVDACYGGLAAVGSRSLKTSTSNYISKVAEDKSRQIITAGGKDEKVMEKADWGHSAFTMNLLRALQDEKADLNSDGYITAIELGMFLKERVTIDTDYTQTPQFRQFTSHEGEFIFQIDNINIFINDDSKIDSIKNSQIIELDSIKNQIRLSQTILDNKSELALIDDFNIYKKSEHGNYYVKEQKDKGKPKENLISFSPIGMQFSHFIKDGKREINILYYRDLWNSISYNNESTINNIKTKDEEFQKSHDVFNIKYRYYLEKSYSGAFGGLSLKLSKAEFSYYDFGELIHSDSGYGIFAGIEGGYRINYYAFTIAPLLGIGYRICDIENQNNEKYLNGATLNIGIGVGFYIGNIQILNQKKNN